ncbi:MAG TPA: hypothetical protein VGL13_01200, partial [Polyangiaceae bacterium]
MRSSRLGTKCVALMAAALGLGTGFWACSSNDAHTAEQNDSAGSVGLSLQLTPGTTLASVSYAITGPGGFSKSGTIDVSSSTTISSVIGGLPAGNGYSITLSATSTDGVTTCSGTGTF